MSPGRSPLDVPAVSTDITRAEVLALVRESRRPPQVDQEALAVRKRAASRRGKGPGAGGMTREAASFCDTLCGHNLGEPSHA
jgi:hypothetical protein